MANTMTIANKNIVNDFSTSSSLKVPAIIPTNKSNMASILKTLPGYFERLTIQLPAATAATKKGNAKRFIQADICAFVTKLKTNTTKFPVTCAKNKRWAQIKVVVSA